MQALSVNILNSTEQDWAVSLTQGQFRLPMDPRHSRVSTGDWHVTGDMCLFPPCGSIVTLQVSCDACEQILPRSPDWF